MISKYFRNKINSKAFGNVNYDIPNFYIALSKTKPNADGSNITEPTGGGYARVLVANNEINWSLPDVNDIVKNLKTVAFAPATGKQSTEAEPIRYYVFLDSSSGGNYLASGMLANPRAIDIGMRMIFNVGTLQIKLNGE